MEQRKKVVAESKKLLLASVGIILYGVFLNVLAWQFKLVSGGLPGYALITNYLTGFPVGQIVLTLNTILFITAFIFFGKGLSAKGMYGYILLSLSIDTARPLLHLTTTHTIPLVQQILHNGIFGLIGGALISLVVFSGYNVGGYSIISIMINKVKKIPHQNVFLILDALLGILTSIFFGIPAGIVLAANAIGFYFSWKYIMPFLEKTVKVS